MRDLELVPLPYAQDCCGFGGTFSVKFPELSVAMAAEKAKHIGETDAEILIGTDVGCLMNIGGLIKRRGSTVRVLHLAELLCEGISH